MRCESREDDRVEQLTGDASHQMMGEFGYACFDFDKINTVCTDCVGELSNGTRGVSPDWGEV